MSRRQTDRPASLESVRWQVCSPCPAVLTDEVRLELISLVLGDWLFFVTRTEAVVLAHLLDQTIMQRRLLVSMRMQDFAVEVSKPGPFDQLIDGRLDLGRPAAIRRAVNGLQRKGYLFRRRMGEEYAMGLWFPQFKSRYPLT